MISMSFARLRAALTAFSRASLVRTESGWSAHGGEQDEVAVIAGNPRVMSGGGVHGAAAPMLRDRLSLVEVPPGRAVTIRTSQGCSTRPNAS